MTPPTFATQRLDHLGIVAGICDRIDLIQTIDTFVGQTRRKVSVGEAVMAMILNALGFVGRPLYLTPEFFSNKPVDLLIHPRLCASDFTDDTVGRALDCLYEKGVTEVFATVASQALSAFDVQHRFVHLDSTTFSLHGCYDQQSDAENVIQVTHGYSRDHRPDLKQVVVQLICSYQSHLPVWLEVLDGNQTDKTSFPQTIAAYLEELRGDAPYFIADSALYTAANLATLSNVRFITRVPETLTAVKALYESLSIEDMRPASENGYRYHCVESTYAGVDQRWLVVYSEAAYKREVATLEKQIAKKRKTAEKATQHLRCKEFDAEMDAHEAARLLAAAWRYHKFSKVERVCVPHYPNQGRPKKDAHPTRIGFRIVAEILQDAEAIQAVKKQKGKFVLATNELDATRLDEATMLSAYKAQNVSVERGFRFLKDPLFFASSLFLEKPQRIMALLMVMGLALLVYALAERWLRTELIKQKQTLVNQVGKPTQRPTLRRIFQVFEGIDVLLTQQGEDTQRLVVNLKPIHYQILDLFGGDIKKCYIPDQ